MDGSDGGIEPIIDLLRRRRGFDFSGYHPAMRERRIRRRLGVTGCGGFGDYLALLRQDEDELERLLDALTINVSRFFRDTLTFELLADRVLPAIVQEKRQTGDESLRVWSAGCARGEEPYTLAILIAELARKEGFAPELHLFATDIDARALRDAEAGLYPPDSVENVRHRLLTRYFTPAGGSFRLLPQIRERVRFSLHDLLDQRCGVPRESVFGGFDLLLCRNVLIYYNIETQRRIVAGLHRALAPGGCLVLGQAEAPTGPERPLFRRLFDFSPIYRRG